MKRYVWLWPVVALAILGVYYAVGAIHMIGPPHYVYGPVHHHRYVFRWPTGSFGVVVRVFFYGSVIGMGTLIPAGAAVAIFIYLKQNRRGRATSRSTVR